MDQGGGALRGSATSPVDGFVNGGEVLTGQPLDDVGLSEPLIVGASLVFDHRSKSIQLGRNAASHGIFRHYVDKS